MKDWLNPREQLEGRIQLPNVPQKAYLGFCYACVAPDHACDCLKEWEDRHKRNLEPVYKFTKPFVK